MSSLDFDLDMTMSRLEREWRHAFDTSVIARSDYQILAASSHSGPIIRNCKDRKSVV